MLPSPGTGDVRRRWDLCVMWWYGRVVEGGAVERGGEESWWDMVRMGRLREVLMVLVVLVRRTLCKARWEEVFGEDG